MCKNVRKPLFFVGKCTWFIKKNKKCFELNSILNEFKLLFIWNMGYKRQIYTITKYILIAVYTRPLLKAFILKSVVLRALLHSCRV